MKPLNTAVDSTVEVTSAEPAASGLSAGWRSNPAVRIVGSATLAAIVIIGVQAGYDALRGVVMKKSIEEAKARAEAERRASEIRLSDMIGTAVADKLGSAIGDHVGKQISGVMKEAMVELGSKLTLATEKTCDTLVSNVRAMSADIQKKIENASKATA